MYIIWCILYMYIVYARGGMILMVGLKMPKAY